MPNHRVSAKIPQPTRHDPSLLFQRRKFQALIDVMAKVPLRSDDVTSLFYVYHAAFELDNVKLAEQLIERINKAPFDSVANQISATLGIQIGQALLSHGYYAQGYRYRSLRIRAGMNVREGMRFAAPLIIEKEKVGERTILVAEQGLDATLLCARDVTRALAELPGDVRLVVDHSVADLFQVSAFKDKVLSSDDVEDFKPDGQVFLTDLPALMGEDALADAITFDVPSKSVSAIKKRYTKMFGKKKRVGLIWTPNPDKEGDARSIELSDLAELIATPGMAFIDMQTGEASFQREGFRDQYEKLDLYNDPNLDLTATIRPIAEQMLALDAVVTVDAPLAHLAGSLGVPTMLVLPKPRSFFRPWQWEAAEDGHCKAYPSITPVLQQPDETWEPALAKVQSWLKAL